MIFSEFGKFLTLLRTSTAAFIGLAFATMLPSTSFAQSVEYVIFSIKGTQTSLVLGQKLLEGEQIDIPTNVEVQMISKLGEVISLIGPVTATVTNETDNIEGETALTKINNILFVGEKFTQTLGGTRSTNNETDIRNFAAYNAAKDPWYPILTSDQIYCIKDETKLTRNIDLGKKIRIKFNDENAENQIASWKAGAKGIGYADLIHSNELEPIKASENDSLHIIINIAPKHLGSLTEQVAWLAQKGCKSQAIELLARSSK